MAVASIGVTLLDSLPENLKPPDGLVLKPSSIAANEIGVWCSETIDVGKRFGPFRGEIVTQYKSGQSLDNYAWEVLDLATHEFLHYVDSTDLSKSNWMRFVRCANYFEEQNIVSEQEGTEIYYKVIKAIQPNEELLTWYDLSQFKKSVRARSRLRKTGRKPLKKLKISQNNAAILADSMDDSHDRKFGDSERPSGPTKKRPESDSDRSPRSRRKPSILDSYVCGEEALPEMDGRRNRLSSTKSNSPKILFDSTSPKLLESSAQMKLIKLGDEQKVLSGVEDADEGHFHFMMTSEHLVQDGRHFLFKCDVCCATYRHAFSLKRHFLRRHVNYAYITEHDRVNCGLNGRRYLELQAQVNGDPNLDNLSDTVVNECTDPDGPKPIQTPRVPGSDSNIAGNSDSKDTLVDGKDVTTIQCELDGKENVEDHCEEYRPVVSPISLPESNNSNQELSTSNNSSGTGSDVMSVAKAISVSEEAKVSEKNSLLDAFFESQLAVLNKKLAALDGRQETSPHRKEFTNYDQPILLKSVQVFWCEHCNRLYPGLAELKAHYKDEHPFAKDVREKNEWRCSECELKFLSRKEYEKHVRSHEENIDLTCPKCGKVFKTLGRFRKHEENVQCVGRIRCRICPADFANRRNFLEHYRRFHEEQIDADPTTTFTAPDNNGHGAAAVVSAPDQNFSTDSVEEKIDRKDRDQSLKLANQTHGFRFACTICKKRFREYHYMCRHRRLAHQAPKRRLGNKQASKDEGVNREREEDPSAFYANVAKNIAENLSFFIDGKRDSLESQIHQQGDGIDAPSIGQLDPDWCSMNFDESHDPRTWHDCVPQIAVDLSGKVDCDSSKDRRKVADVIQTRIQPCSNPQFVSRNKQQRLEAFNFYNGNPRLRYVCLVCAARYESMDKLDDHYCASHSTVLNDHIELDVDCSPPVFARPTTQGILGKLITPEVVYRQEYRCTKCEEKFDKIDLLHSHIVTCGPLLSDEMLQSASKKFFIPRKFRSYGLFGCQKLRKFTSERRKPTRPLSPVDDTSLVAQEEPTRRTTRSLDHSYDPRRHVRRRDTRPVLDTEQCRACLKHFKNLLELERHARVCSKKQLFRTSICQSSIGMKCIYCLKHFTYKLSLKKHLIDVCKIKKQLLETDLLPVDKLEEEGLLLQQIEENLPLVTVKEKVNDLTKKKKRRRARLGLKPSVKKAIEFKLKKRRGLKRVKSEKTTETEPTAHELTATETRSPEKTTDIFINENIGKRSRKMTVKALESVTLQMTLDCISNSEKLRAGIKSAKKAKANKAKKQQIMDETRSEDVVRPSAVVSNSEENNHQQTKKPAEKNDLENVQTKDVNDVSRDITQETADVHSNGDTTSLDAKPVDEEIPPMLGSKKGRKRKSPETKTTSKSDECVPPKKSVINSRPKHLLDDDWESVSSGDPYEFHVEKTVQDEQEENSVLRFTKDGRLRKKPGRKPRKSVTNGHDKSSSPSKETTDKNSSVKGRKLEKSAGAEVPVKTRKNGSDSKDRKSSLNKAIPLVFSKRVANLQKRLKKL